MKYLLIAFWAMLVPFLTLPAQTTVQCEVYFDTGKYVLTESAQSILDSLVDHEKIQVIKGVRVQGHTDAVGSLEFNEELSKNRALTVARYLRDHGIKARAVRLKAHGEVQPVASNATTAGRARNRRVELTVYLGEMKDPEPEIVEVLPELPDSIVEGNEAEYHCSQSLTLEGRRGASIYLPPAAFDSCGKPIEVRLLEYHTLEDVANKEVSTMAGDTILESAGMFCLSAFMDRVEIDRLREGQEVEVRIPADRYDPTMGLYTAPRRGDLSQLAWERLQNQMPEYEAETNSYLIRISSLGCVNLDKPACGTAMPIAAVRVKRRMLRRHSLYMEYADRGTFSEGELIKKRGKIFTKYYYTFGSVETSEDLRLKGYFWTRKQRYGINKELKHDRFRGEIIKLEGRDYSLVAKITPRAINRTDRFQNQRTIVGTALPNIQ